MKIYLASKSPRRKELLQQMQVPFEVLCVHTPEIPRPGETPIQYSKRVTIEKLYAARDKIQNESLFSLPVLAADTEVVLDNEILGKPFDENDAFNMIRKYSERTHQVITTVGLIYKHDEKIETNITHVTFDKISDAEIKYYLASGNYKDKSGSYGIQSYIGQFISRIEGCFYSVMGLPLNTVRTMLNDLKREEK